MGKRSRDKGKRGEIEWRDFLRGYGYHAERGAQRQGGADTPDVKSNDLDDFLHVEVKRVERLNIHKALEQAEEEAADKIPYVAHRRNGDVWKVTIDAENFVWMLTQLWPPGEAAARELGL